MIKINTKAYGLIEVDERQKIFFPQGLFGFENLKDFVLLDAEQKPFYWLQSVDVKEIAFVLINPSIFRKEYQLNVEESDLEEIGLKSADVESMLIFSIVTLPENHQLMSANLQGPLIINSKKRIARQSISLNPKDKTKHYILEELSNKRNQVC